MKKLIVFVLSGIMFTGCQRDQGVQAGSEYQPRPAPAMSRELRGELVRVDEKAKTIRIRLENGMLQTFKFDDNTRVEGLNGRSVHQLASKEGAEVTVHWDEDEGAKRVADIAVTKRPTSSSR
jgi:hypothetical protein